MHFEECGKNFIMELVCQLDSLRHSLSLRLLISQSELIALHLYISRGLCQIHSMRKALADQHDGDQRTHEPPGSFVTVGNGEEQCDTGDSQVAEETLHRRSEEHLVEHRSEVLPHRSSSSKD